MNREDRMLCLQRICKKDDYQSFKTLYSFYFFRLLHFCQSIVHQKEPAEEIVDDVFIKLWEKRATLPDIQNPDTYLYVAVKNKSLDYINKNRPEKMTDISSISGKYIQFRLDPEQLMITEDVRNEISSAIDQLPPRCKLIFKLIKEDGLKYKEVASTLNISVKTVEAQFTIAIKKLSAALFVSSTKKNNRGLKVFK